MIVAAAQTRPFTHDTAANIQKHSRMIEYAAGNRVQLILFPEMSLTGYETERAEEFAFSENDSRLEELKAQAALHNIIIIAGAPVKINGQLHIGSFIIFPDDTISIYTKQFLYGAEEIFFTPNINFNPMIELKKEKIALAICADISHPSHPRNAAKNKATMYAASIFYSPGGIEKACKMLSDYARRYSMNVLMSNFGGPSHEMQSAGQSGFWNNKGVLIGAIENEKEGLLIVDDLNNEWEASVHLFE